MNSKKKYGSLAAWLIVLLFFATNPANIKPGFIFLGAASVVIILSIRRNFINGLFGSLFFIFAFYALHPGVPAAAVLLNLLFFTAFSYTSEKLKKVKKEVKKEKTSASEKAFINKVLNSFILAHDMLMQVKKGITHTEIYEIFADNLESIISVGHTLIYSADKNDEDNFKLVFSKGEHEKGFIKNSINNKSISELTLRNLTVPEFKLVEGNADLNMLLVPVKESGKAKRIIAVLKDTPFDHSDIYIIEFFAAQIFVIIEKQELFARLKSNYERIIEVLSLAIDVKDHETHGHSLSTMKYAIRIAEKMNLSEDEKEKVKYASLLHDIGKINISSKILRKPSSLTDEEYEIIKQHPKEGGRILEKLELFDEILPVIKHHHEHINGKGYPERLKGENIPLGSRICAIADAYSVMRSNRPYKKAMTKEDAVNELKKCAGSQFDSKIVDVFLDIVNEEKDDASGTDEPEKIIN